MRRLPLLALLALAALGAGCVHEAPGACADDAGCRTGEHCAGGVCLRNGQVALGGACELQAECASWATCAAGRCALRPGACEAEPHCAAWQDCGAAHACVLAAGFCEGDAECTSWRTCSAHTCVVRPGSCEDESDCAAWQECGTDHACRPAPGRCGVDADCAEWQACSANACAPAAGRCESRSQCAAWEYCTAGHLCAPEGQTCTADVDCESWQVCSSGHCANRPGYCGAAEQCEAWQTCDASHACATGPGRCATSNDCAAWETCGLDHVCAATTCESDADCLPGEPCTFATGSSLGVCTVPHAGYDPRGIVIFAGMTIEGACGYSSLSSLLTPTRVAVGFDCGDREFNGKANVTEDGGIVFVGGANAGDRKLMRFVPDSWTWDATRRLSQPPLDPAANDTVLPTPGCAGRGVYDAVFQAGTGAYVYRCMSESGTRWYDEDGAVVLEDYDVRAWNEAGLMIAWRAGGWWLLDASGAPIGADLSVGFPAGTGVLHARTHGAGFRLLVGSIDGTVFERWYVAPDGSATRDGVYAGVPAGIWLFWQRVVVMDAAGDMYGFAMSATVPLNDLVVRCELQPGTCETVYDEGTAPEVRWDVFPPRVFTFLHGSSLITGP